LCRKTKRSKLAQEHLKQVSEWLGKIDASLSELANSHTPATTNGNSKSSSKSTGKSSNHTNSASKKRKASESDLTSGNNKQSQQKPTKKRNANSELAAREERALEQLHEMISQQTSKAHGLLEGYSTRVTKKSNGRFDVLYYNPEGRRFRSMLEVARFLNINVSVKVNKTSRKSSAKEAEEKKRIRREMERLRKQWHRATKNLEEWQNEDTTEQTSETPLPDAVLVSNKTRANAPGARQCDFTGFPDIPDYCTPDVIMVWDFLCTFSRALSWAPTALDDFAMALAYRPPQGLIGGDDVMAPPVMLAEAHIALLKLLFHDKSSDDWWWCTLETEEAVNNSTKIDGSNPLASPSAKVTPNAVIEVEPCILFNVKALLERTEEAVVTTSWLQTLENVNDKTTREDLKYTLLAARKITANKWVAAYLRKSRQGISVHGLSWACQAIQWLVSFIKQARPELSNFTITADEIQQYRLRAIEKYDTQASILATTTPCIADSDVVSDYEYDDEDDSDDSDEEDEDMEDMNNKNNDDIESKPASIIPPRPLPTLTDMLLPPTKPTQNAEYLNPFTWSHLVGATAMRILHRKKRIWNEIDDNLRLSRQLAPLTIPERRRREEVAEARMLTECAKGQTENPLPTSRAVEHLCSGGTYLELTAAERLCLMRLLIEAAYDTGRVYDVVDGNYKQRTNAMKSLEQEQRKAKKDAKEKAAADEAAARAKLAQEAREAFLDEKRDEIKKLNDKSKEFADDVIESFTDEDILEFDEDIKADYEALPGPDSFSKAQVTEMIRRMHEEAAFDTDTLRVISLGELTRRETRDLEEMEGQLMGFGGDDALLDTSTMDKETIRSIERLKKDIERARQDNEKLPELRDRAIEQLRDAMEDGTIKVLRSAIAAAKKAKLTGADDETGGTWAVDIMRDAALELENAKQNKKVIDAQKDLIAKRNKCFIRNDALGSDRFGNRFWAFENDEGGHIWTETEHVITSNGDSLKRDAMPGYLDLFANGETITTGAKDMEEDLVSDEESDFVRFSRIEYHHTGEIAALVQHHWGCHATEGSLRNIIKSLDSRGYHENLLKGVLKESLEQTLEGVKDDKHESVGADEEQIVSSTQSLQVSGDEDAFEAVKSQYGSESDVGDELRLLTTAIGGKVRVRITLGTGKDTSVARYENGVVTGWRTSDNKPEMNGSESDEQEQSQPSHEWKVSTDRGHVLWLQGSELPESIRRYSKFANGKLAFEQDSAFVAYRNSMGRYCGKATDAPYAASPNYFARLMVKREGELYPKLKVRTYDNSWGGKSGTRAMWTNSMKDYAFDFVTVRQGLLTLENAFFELTGGFSEYTLADDSSPDAVALLADPSSRMEIELESIEKNVPGLWNSPLSRAVFIEIVASSKTTGFLALALDLLCRNTTKFLRQHKLMKVRPEVDTYSEKPVRATRRKNAWQQANEEENDDDEDDGAFGDDNDDDDSDEDWR
jgi:DDT domain/Williams-Beuren syndrome DDT (WSD), D-TOX E motif/Methyl-CpG binding domain